MVSQRPVDLFRKPVGFRFTRPSALYLECCARCARDVVVAELSDEDAREYRISACCPTCATYLFDLWAEECE